MAALCLIVSNFTVGLMLYRGVMSWLCPKIKFLAVRSGDTSLGNTHTRGVFD